MALLLTPFCRLVAAAPPRALIPVADGLVDVGDTVSCVRDTLGLPLQGKVVSATSASFDALVTVETDGGTRHECRASSLYIRPWRWFATH